MEFNYDKIEKYEIIEIDGHKVKMWSEAYLSEAMREANYYKEQWQKELKAKK